MTSSTTAPGPAGIDLRGDTALVTGGSRGIGRACCLMLAQAGAQVMVHYRTREMEAAEVTGAIRAAGGVAVALSADLADEAQVGRLVSGAVSSLGAPTILVNNAGIWEGRAIDELTLAEWERTF